MIISSDSNADIDLETGSANSGVMLIRCSEWSAELFRRWWAHPGATQNKADQWVLDRVREALPESDKPLIEQLPEEAMNCGTKWWRVVPQASPVLHLMNTPNQVRERLGAGIFKELWCPASCTNSSNHTRNRPMEFDLQWLHGLIRQSFRDAIG